MRALAVASLAAVAAAEVPLLWGRAPWWAAIALALAVIALLACRLVPQPRQAASVDPEPEPVGALPRWRRRTETLISWSEGSRADWDQHLRPMLARELRKAFSAGIDATTGAILFGPQLWPWVDPSAVAAGAEATRPGPGREALGAILDRLDTL